MAPQEFLLVVFCLVDDELKAPDLPPPRTRGPRPTLADSEVIAVEIAGEFWGITDDRALYRHFRRYHRAEFPALATVDRSTFVRRAASSIWSGVRPAAIPAPMMAPMLVPTIRVGRSPSRSSPRATPMCAQPRAPPPPSASVNPSPNVTRAPGIRTDRGA